LTRRSRPGDRVVRVERVQPSLLRGTLTRPIRRAPAPALALVVSFATLIAVGTVLLALPFSSRSGDWTRPVDALFSATSAVCVTGLVVVDTGTYWSGFGQAVILALIQLGGFGFMVSSTALLLLLTRRRTTLRERLVVHESLGRYELGGAVTLLRRVAAFTLVCEAVGATVLVAHQLIERGMEPADVWRGLFHAVSAFNNAGIDIVGDFRSLTGYQRDWVLLPAVGVLIVLGGLGYAVTSDAWRRRGRWRRLALETKVVLVTTAALLGVGAASIAVTEWTNPETLGALPPAERILNAAFHAIVPRTAGFNSLEMPSLRDQTLVLTMALMFIGGASGSTAGGIKVNTFSVLLVAIVSTVRGRPSAEAFGRRIPHIVVYRALSVALLYIAVAFAVALLLQLDATTAFLETVFETISALGTVGLSTGITPTLPDPARVVLALTMFVGRLGPLTLVLALAARARAVPYRPAVETLRIG
jgi:trk system potassium uptake protein